MRRRARPACWRAVRAGPKLFRDLPPIIMRHHTIAVALLLACAPAAHAQHVIGERDARARSADSVFRHLDRTDSPGCALGVYRDGEILYARGYGMANLQHGVPLSPRSVLDVGSISKQFTAMAILLLEREGKLSLDDPLRKHFPEMPAYADRVTLRHALSQTSGLRDLWTMWGQTGRTFAGDTIDALRIITRAAEPNYEPGARYLYTNSGWILAAQLVYRLTGKTLAQFADERIFAPLGMRHTRYLGDAGLVIPDHAEAYAPRGSTGFRLARNSYDGAIVGAGGVHTSIEDFGRWLMNYDSATVGDRRILETMTTPTKLNDGSPAMSGRTQAYAIGLSVGTLRGVRMISHGGSWAGYRAHFFRFPDERLAVATFCNVSNAGPDSLARKVAAIYLGERMQPDSAAIWVASLAGAATATLPAGALRPLAGSWRNVERGEVRRTRVSGDTLYMVTGERRRMVPIEGGRFRLGPGTVVRFEGDPLRPARMIVGTAAEDVTFERADTAALTPAQLAQYAGEYWNDEVEAAHTWRVEKGELVAYANHRRLGVLEPAFRDGFTLGSRVIEVQRDRRGRITGFVLESGRVRGLKFTRR